METYGKPDAHVMLVTSRFMNVWCGGRSASPETSTPNLLKPCSALLGSPYLPPYVASFASVHRRSFVVAGALVPL
jgi:hypothetical protein